MMIETPERPNTRAEKKAPALRPVIGSLIQREIDGDGICILTFDRPDSGANLFDRPTLDELDRHVHAIASDPKLTGLIVRSAKPSIFIAGADLHSLSAADGADQLRELIVRGQDVFNRIAALKIPSVAAIHGACLGGGYEIALACDYRLASAERETKIGLPETQLGILPAWGGSTRLPRLIGLPKALDVILGGKTLAAKQALKYGMVDELVPREYLLELARQRISERGLGLRTRALPLGTRLLNQSPAVGLIRKKVAAQVLKKTRGHYPAVLKALEVVTRGLNKPIEEALALEADAILELAQTQASRNLLRIFFLQERAKKLAVKNVPAHAQPTKPIKRIGVIGAGVMGAGIAQWSTARGVAVLLKDINPEQVAKGMGEIATLYADGTKRHAFSRTEARGGFDRIYPVNSDLPLRNAELIVEAAVEKMVLKKQIFAALDEVTGPDTVLATNTSALSVSELARSTRHPERVVGIHFFNPVQRMQLVEVVAGEQTRPDVLQRAVRFVQQIGKLPVVVKDSPGFVVNRILMPYLIEAGTLFENGAETRDIDEAMLEFGMPMGPLRLIDEVGVDVSSHVAQTLSNFFSDRLLSPAVLAKMLEAGWLGRKSGQGFYLHKGKEARVNPAAAKFRLGDSAAKLSRAELQNRMVLLMVNEAARCVEAGIVETPADVDFAMIMGTGFAPFLGGPLRFADFIGANQLVAEMKRISDAGDRRFAPCRLLEDMARQGKQFYQEKGKSL